MIYVFFSLYQILIQWLISTFNTFFVIYWEIACSKRETVIIFKWYPGICRNGVFVHSSFSSGVFVHSLSCAASISSLILFTHSYKCVSFMLYTQRHTLVMLENKKHGITTLEEKSKETQSGIAWRDTGCQN